MGKPKTSSIWKTSYRGAKLSKMWASGFSIQWIQGTFDKVVKVILGSFAALPIFDNLVSRKRLVVSESDSNLGLEGKVLG